MRIIFLTALNFIYPLNTIQEKNDIIMFTVIMPSVLLVFFVDYLIPTKRTFQNFNKLICDEKHFFFCLILFTKEKDNVKKIEMSQKKCRSSSRINCCYCSAQYTVKCEGCIILFVVRLYEYHNAYYDHITYRRTHFYSHAWFLMLILIH